MKKLLLILLLGLSVASSDSNKNMDLWLEMKEKFEIQLVQDYINDDHNAFYSYFAPNYKINVYQYGSDKTGKSGEGKNLRIYTGNIFSSLLKFRIPGKIFVKTFFKRLKRQDYKQSNIELLGIKTKNDKLSVYIRFDRVNNSDEIYLSARALYTMTKINGEWLTTEMSTFDDNEEVNSKVDFDKMWKP